MNGVNRQPLWLCVHLPPWRWISSMVCVGSFSGCVVMCCAFLEGSYLLGEVDAVLVKMKPLQWKRGLGYRSTWNVFRGRLRE